MITIYTTPTCAYCKAVKKYLEDKGHAFEEKDITQDSDGANWVMKNTEQLAVPVTDINGNVIVGFDKPKIDAALKTL